MFRIAGRAAYQICRRETGATAQFVKTTITPAGSALRSTVDCWRGFSAPSGGGEGESRLVDVSTKEQFVDFPRDKSVLYFTAKWCPPCRRIGPFFAELSSETPGVDFGKVDIDDNPDATSMAKVMSVPTFKFYKGGEEIDSVSGADATLVEQKVASLAES